MTRKIERRVTMRQIDGDDGFQWCVLVDGRVKWNGMTRAEASWRRKQEIEILEANERLR